MKKTGLFSLAAALLCATLTITGCDSGEGTGEQESKEITVKDKSALTQSVWADETTTAKEISFTTTGPWTSSIATTNASRAAVDGWFSITPESGDEAGDHTVAVTLAPNRTGQQRKAVVTILCGNSDIKITITQKAENKNGTSEQYPLDELVGVCNEFYDKMVNDYNIIDLEFYSESARKTKINTSTDILYDIWQSGYETIKYCNLVLETIDLDKEKTAEQKAGILSTVAMLRGTSYLFLKTLFGRIPLTTASDVAATEVPQSSIAEIDAHIFNDLDLAIANLSEDMQLYAYMAKIIHAMQSQEFAKAADVAKEIFDKYNLRFTDLNDDQAINGEDIAEDNIYVGQVYLLAAEANVRTGAIDQAKSYVNNLYMQMGLNMPFSEGPSATQEEVMGVIQNKFSEFNTGMKFMNMVRWGSTASWEEKYTLMPIPLEVMDENPNLTQNTGW